MTLIEQLSKLPVGGRDRDADFMEAIGFKVKRDGCWRYKDGYYWYAIPNVTTDEASIIRMIRRDFPHSRMRLETAQDGDRFVSEVWGCGPDRPVNEPASTPALALCVAYLVAGRGGHE